LKAFSADEFRARMLATCQRMIDSSDRLCEADRDLGDGDHGVTMARAFKAARDALLSAPPSPGGDLTSLGAKLMGAGGTAGIVFGTWFSTAGRAVGSRELDAALLATAMTDGAEAVRTRSRASPGDKTMIDALLPAVEALSASANGDVEVALDKAALAAAQGAEATREMAARVGKAKTMGDRAKGFVDPGALSVTIIFEGLAAKP
jgi:phosphoenolpyruvate---glycerone phosphotransferase subunit DhaL